MYVFMYVCMYVFMYVYVRMCVCVCMRVCMCVNAYVRQLIVVGVASTDFNYELTIPESTTAATCSRYKTLMHVMRTSTCLHVIPTAVAQSGTTPVYAAARGGHWHIVYALIKRGADVDKPHQVSQ